ncbi:DUF3592 domain-containing protein [uncultured Friedmanniella sp.]|uniref:DUF3592 domain-containing protein n=1 Tax=uncultured Friedmanniella sp. TaxID=335381 RepID=UPI0035CCA4D3
MPDPFSWLPPTFLGVGLLAVVLGTLAVVRDRRRRNEWTSYPGRVVGSRLDDGQIRCRVSYVRDGREVIFWNRFSSTTMSDPVGREVEVLVNPENPDDAMVSRGLVGGTAFGFGLLGFGVLASVVGATWLRR